LELLPRGGWVEVCDLDDVVVGGFDGDVEGFGRRVDRVAVLVCFVVTAEGVEVVNRDDGVVGDGVVFGVVVDVVCPVVWVVDVYGI